MGRRPGGCGRPGRGPLNFFVSCAKGTEGALRRELADLRIRAPRGETGGVSFSGPFEAGMKACLWSRVGVRVLLELGAFAAPDATALYDGARALPWADHLGRDTTFAVSAVVQDSDTLRHSGFTALKVKDAVVDTLRERLGARPDVDARDPDVAIFLHLRGAAARLYLDMAGEPLHRRGYRVAMTDAPLKETLAAAVLALGKVDTSIPFIDPMTGSGTLAIEHAMVGRRLAPGLRRRFGFERWPEAKVRTAWAHLRDEALAAALPVCPAPIEARDSAPQAVRAARSNAEAAGVLGDLRIELGDATALGPRPGPGTLCVNPPYGERMPGPGPDGSLDRTYRELARALRGMSGWATVVLAGNPLLSRAMGGRPAFSHRLWNGPLEARLLRYDP